MGIYKYTLVCFGGILWQNMWKRNQSMIREISQSSKIENIIFVNPSVWGFSRIAQQIFSTSTSAKQFKVKIISPLHIVPLKKHFKCASRFENMIFERMIYRNFGANTKLILFINTVEECYFDLILKIIPIADVKIFDVSDDFTEFKGTISKKTTIYDNLTKILPLMDLVITVNDHVLSKYQHLNSNMIVVNNGTNYNNFARPFYSKIALFDSFSDKPLIGYIGTANLSRLDLKLLDLLVSNKNWNLVFVGNTEHEIYERYSKSNNVIFVKSVPYSDLPNYINYFNVCIIPLLVNEHTKGNDLLKIHDYLAMGKPIVSTDIGGASKYSSVINISRSNQEFMKLVNSSIDENTAEMIAKRKAVAFENSWECKKDYLINMLDKLVDGTKS